MVFAWSGPARLESQIGKDYDALYGEGSFLEDNRIAKLYPSEDGNSYYQVDTGPGLKATSLHRWMMKRWRRSAGCLIFSIRKKASALCIAVSRERTTTSWMAKSLWKTRRRPDEEHTFKNVNSNIADLAMWNPEYWDSEYPSTISEEYLAS